MTSSVISHLTVIHLFSLVEFSLWSIHPDDLLYTWIKSCQILTRSVNILINHKNMMSYHKLQITLMSKIQIWKNS